MSTLHLLDPGVDPGRHEGEALACAFTPEGNAVLSGGWDGFLRLWEAETGAQVEELPAANKPISACTVSPDGRQWLCGSMDGLLAGWDGTRQYQQLVFLAHTRPLSAIVFAPDGQTVATASWDRTLIVWRSLAERDGRALTGHQDIVAGCGFTPDGRRLLSWSHDGTLRLWDLERYTELDTLGRHEDRVTTGALSPDGRWAATGARDGSLKLWDLLRRSEEGATGLFAEVRACFFLLDAESLLTVEADGRLLLQSVPDFQERASLETGLRIQCAQISPSGSQVALGCDDGRIYLVALEDCDIAPPVVTATHTSRRTSSPLERLFGRSRVVDAYACTCPACRHTFEVPRAVPGQPASCPRCSRTLRINPVTLSV